MPRRLPPLNALRAFEAAARHLSFTRAAEELHVTQTAISHHVKSLEQHLGFRLFRRVNNTLVLTERGEAYLPILREAFDRIAEGTDEIQSDRPIKELTVSVQPNFALRWLIPRLPRFQARQPKIEIRIFTAYRALDFLREEIDVAVRIGNDWPGLNCDFLFEAEMFPVCSPDWARAHPLREPADVTANTLLHVYYAPEDWRLWLNAAGVAVEDHLRGPKFDSYALALEAARHSCGIGMGRGPFIEDDVKAGRLIVPFDLRIKQDKAWYLVWPRSNLDSKLMAFRSWMLEEAARTREQQAP